MCDKIGLIIAGCIVGAIFLSSIIVNIVFSFKMKEYELDDSIITHLTRDLKTKLIYNFTTRSDQCEEGEEQLILGKFLGSTPKCKCYESIINKTCSSEEPSYCVTYNGDPKDYTKINGNMICVKRGEKTYGDLIKENLLIKNNGTCPNNTISCGIIDTLGSKLCITSGERCPITDVAIKKENSLNADSIKKYEKYNSINIGNEYKLYYLNGENEDENNQILSFFTISEDLPCINPMEKRWNDYDPDYKNKHPKCSSFKRKQYDDRYKAISGYHSSIKKLYQDNGLDGFINSDLDI